LFADVHRRCAGLTVATTPTYVRSVRPYRIQQSQRFRSRYTRTSPA
jgi:hypothetical protein